MARVALVRPDPDRLVYSTDGGSAGDRELVRATVDAATLATITSSTSGGDFGLGLGSWWWRPAPDRSTVMLSRYPYNGVSAANVYTDHELWTCEPDGTSLALRMGQPGSGTVPADWLAYGHPEWQPDGQRIAVFVVTAAGSAIVKANMDGTALRTVAADAAGNGIIDPAFNPAGDRLIFVCDDSIVTIPNTQASTTEPQILVGDWTTLRTLAADAGAVGNYDPYYSPDGTRIAWLQKVTDLRWRIKIMDADGSDVATVIDDGNINSMPMWSSDGQWLYFHRLVLADLRWSLAKIRPDGTGLANVLTTAGRNYEFPSIERGLRPAAGRPGRIRRASPVA